MQLCTANGWTTSKVFTQHATIECSHKADAASVSVVGEDGCEKRLGETAGS